MVIYGFGAESRPAWTRMVARGFMGLLAYI